MIVQFEQDSQAIVQEETSSVELSPGQWLENVRKLPLDVQILTSSSVQGVNSAASLVDFLHREGDSFSEINQKRFLRASTTSRYTHCIVQIFYTNSCNFQELSSAHPRCSWRFGETQSWTYKRWSSVIILKLLSLFFSKESASTSRYLAPQTATC